MKELICIVCPKGCRLTVDVENDYAVSGNSCPRGALYGKNEILNPVRVLTSTVKISGALHRRCPVRTETAVPKSALSDIMKELDSVELESPVRIGDVALKNAAGTGVDVIVTKDL